MNKKIIGTVIILLIFASLPMIYYYISHNLTILDASEGTVAGSLIGYYAATKQKKAKTKSVQ